MLFDLATAANRGDTVLAAQLKALGGVLGLLQRDPQLFLQAAPAGGLSNEEIDAKVGARATSRTGRREPPGVGPERPRRTASADFRAWSADAARTGRAQ